MQRLESNIGDRLKSPSCLNLPTFAVAVQDSNGRKGIPVASCRMAVPLNKSNGYPGDPWNVDRKVIERIVLTEHIRNHEPCTNNSNPNVSSALHTPLFFTHLGVRHS